MNLGTLQHGVGTALRTAAGVAVVGGIGAGGGAMVASLHKGDDQGIRSAAKSTAIGGGITAAVGLGFAGLVLFSTRNAGIADTIGAGILAGGGWSAGLLGGGVATLAGGALGGMQLVNHHGN